MTRSRLCWGLLLQEHTEVGGMRNKVRSATGEEKRTPWEESEKTLIFNVGLVAAHPRRLSK